MTNTTPSETSSPHWPEKAQHWSLQGENGRTLVMCLDPGVASRGDCSTRNIQAWRNDANASTLWPVLSTDPIPAKFFLKKSRADKLLARALRLGQTLPALLHKALSAGRFQ